MPLELRIWPTAGNRAKPGDSAIDASMSLLAASIVNSDPLLCQAPGAAEYAGMHREH